MMLDIKNGQRFNKLVVIEELPRLRLPSGQVNRVFKCKCDCGNTTNVRLVHLSRGRTLSCGCITTKSGKPRHYKTNTKLYNMWRGIKNRVKPYHSERHLYYDRNIDICDEWLNDFDAFENFALKNGYKKGLQIDRKDNDKGYHPWNCRFVTSFVNVNNRRNTVRVKYKGIEFAFMDLIRKKKLENHIGAISDRIKRGYSVDDAFDKPIRKGNYKRSKTK